MTAPQLTKDWLITPNVRKAHVSLVTTTAWFLYENKAAMLAAGWTVRFSSDGAAGPADANDATDRWASAANTAVRGAAAGNPQSWIVLQNVDGVQVLLTFQGAADHNARLSMSQIGGFTLAATTTHQPTATQEIVFHAAGDTMVNSTASLDRVMSVFCSDDSRQWCFALYRNNALIEVGGVEWINNLCSPAGIFSTNGGTPKPYIGFRYTDVSRDSTTVIGVPVGNSNGTAIGTAGFLGAACRVFTAGAGRSNRIGGMSFKAANNAGNFVNNTELLYSVATTAALQGTTSPLLPVYFFGERAANLDGILGYASDWYQALTNAFTTPATGDFTPGFDLADVPGVSGGQTGIGDVRTNWFVALGAGMVRPWRNAAATLQRI